MRMKLTRLFQLLFVVAGFVAANSCANGEIEHPKMKDVVGRAIEPLMQEYRIPGMAVGVTVNGENYFFNYGVASTEHQEPVTSETLFEIGSISKTFTATLASYAELNGNLSLSDNVSKYLPSLQGSSFDNISLLNLGTHTSGGLPLQVPDTVDNTEKLNDYFKNWQPLYPPGTRRSYSNASIGLLGMIAAKSMNESFDDLIEKKLFPALGLNHSHIHLPAERKKDYAQGYTKDGTPIRLSAGVLSSEAYGVKSCSSDLIKFIEANMHLIELDGKWQQAIDGTHIGYFKQGEFTQDLIWEQYPYPTELKRLLDGNSDVMIYQAPVATKLTPPMPPRSDVLINKTGSTNGFSAYVMFIPTKKFGIVILANKSLPIAPRLRAAYQILDP